MLIAVYQKISLLNEKSDLENPQAFREAMLKLDSRFKVIFLTYFHSSFFYLDPTQ